MSRRVWAVLGMMFVAGAIHAEGPSTTITLGVPVSGVVEQVMVQAGERVKAGQELLRLDPRRYRIRLRRAEARLQEMVADLGQAEEDLADQLDLFERLVTSEKSLTDARHRVATIRARVEQSRADRDEAALDLEQSVLRAPVAGVILERRSNPGEVVSSRDHPPALILMGVK